MPAVELLAGRAREVVAGLCDEVPSPCVSICRMDAVTELCEGCYRNLDEIAAWGRMEDGEKREVWKSIEQRLNRRERKSA